MELYWQYQWLNAAWKGELQARPMQERSAAPSSGWRNGAMSAYGLESRQQPPPGSGRLAGTHRQVLLCNTSPVPQGSQAPRIICLRDPFLPVKKPQPTAN